MADRAGARRWPLGYFAFEEGRTDDSRVGKIFIEPHLSDRLGVANPELRFQCCRAPRQDDHVHLQLRQGRDR